MNLFNFNTNKAGSSFLTPNTGTTFNYLWLAFIEALIFQHFDPKYHILIEINVTGYLISDVQS